MAFEAIDTAAIQVKKPVTRSLLSKIKNSLDYLFGEIATLTKAAVVPNASFELDSDSDGMPDRWTKNLYPGGYAGRDLVNAIQGTACLKMTHPGGAGNGGAYVDSDYIPESPLEPVFLSVSHWASNAAMHNRIELHHFDASLVDLGTPQTVYAATLHPTSPALFLVGNTPPAGARFLKIRLVGGKSDVDAAGDAFFDALTLQPVHVALWRPAIQDFTIAEVSTASSSWANIGTAQTAIIPISGLPATLSFTAEGRELLGGYTADMRFVINGTIYTNEVTLNSGPPNTTGIFTADLPAGTVGPLSIQMQLKSNGNTAYGSKTVQDLKAVPTF